MRKGIPALLAALCLLLGGCSSLLERSYSSVEPYTNRYWDTSAEDTLRAESYQDLVNSLLMLVEQRAEEGTIRCYEEANSYIQAQRARSEVRRETALGSYLLKGLTFTYESGSAYSTVAYQMVYREEAEDVAGLMNISDSQSLLDLLRLAVREEHEKQTVRFSYDTPRSDVVAAVEDLWRELIGGESRDHGQPADGAEEEIAAGAAEELPDSDAAPPPPEAAASGGEVPPEDQAPPEEGEAAPVSGEAEPPEEGEPPEEVPPCPWTIRFYPDRETTEIVEIFLEGVWPKA